MSIDPNPVFRGLTAFARPALRLAGEQWHRRGASWDTLKDFGVERELNEALSVLKGDSKHVWEAIATWTKAKASARPELLEELEAIEWLRNSDVEGALKAGAIALMLDTPFEEYRDEAARLYSQSAGDYEWYGRVLADLAIAFLALTVDSKLDTGDRLTLLAVNTSAQENQRNFDAVREVLARIERSQQDLDPGPFPSDIVDPHIAEFVRRENALRIFDDPMRMARVTEIAAKLYDGPLRKASPQSRQSVFRLAAQVLAREGNVDEADRWIEKAVDAGAKDLSADRARVALHRGDWAATLRLVNNRTDPEANGLQVSALEKRDGQQAALAFWRQHVGADGSTGFMITTVAVWLADQGLWTEADSLLNGATDGQIHENAALLLIRARMKMALLVPENHREGLLLHFGAFPAPHLLRDDLTGRQLRDAARKDLVSLIPILEALGRPDLGKVADMNRLFLELASHDETVVASATTELRERLQDPECMLEYAFPALSFEVSFDQAQLRAQLERAKSVGGWSDSELAIAAHLVIRDSDGDQILQFVEEHRDRLQDVLPATLAFGLEVEVLARKGRVADARERLATSTAQLPIDVVARLEAIIAEEEGADEIQTRLETFERTGDDQDLHFLVRALLKRSDPRAAEYAIRLWRIRHRVEDAVDACNALHAARQDTRLEAFLEELGDTVDSSPLLQECAAWSAFWQGDLSDAQLRVEQLRAEDPDRASLRQLEINLAIEGGDWNRLGPLIRQDLENAENRTPQQLLQAAGLAHASNDPRADELMNLAASRAPDDVHVLLQAYGLSVRRGRDWEAEPGSWLRRAIELSGEEGPLQQTTVRDFIEMRDEQIEKSRNLDRMVLGGEVPLALAVRPLGTTLSELVLARLAANVSRQDPRERLCLPLIAGNRARSDLTNVQRVGFDPAAILMLQLAGVLEEAIDTFPTVILPSGTLPLLFSDLERANRTQPVRVARAARIRDLASTRRLEFFEPEPRGSDNFAPLYERARQADGFVVHSSPLYEPGSLLEQVRDPAPFLDRLVSPQSVVAALRVVGEITAAEASEAEARLDGSGPRWPGDAALDLGRPLVIDAGALHMLDETRMLEPLVRAGARPLVDRYILTVAEEEIQQHERARNLERAIDALRLTLRAALSRGKARISPYRRATGGEDELDAAREPELTPLVALLRDASSVDLVISADRTFNQHGRLDDQNGIAKGLATPIDVIDHLLQSGTISAERRATVMRKLREAGVALLPTDPDEVVRCAAEGDWSRGSPRSLRAIRDSIHLPLLRRAVSLPLDRHWLEYAALSLAQAVRRVWARLPAIDSARAAADFLFSSIPVLHAAAAADKSPDATEWGIAGTAAIHALIAAPLGLPNDRIEAYHSWYEDVVLPHLNGRDRSAFDAMIERVVFALTASTDRSRPPGVSAEDVSRAILVLLHPKLQERVLQRPEVRSATGAGHELDIFGHSVAADELTRFLRTTLAGTAGTLVNTAGISLDVSASAAADGSILLEVSDQRLRLMEARLLADDAVARQAALDRMLARHTLAPTIAREWRYAVNNGPLNTEALLQFMEVIRSSPEGFRRKVLAEAAEGLTLETLAAVSSLNFENLIDPKAADGTLPATLEALATSVATHPDPIAAVVGLGPFAVSADFPIAQAAERLNDAEAAALCDRLINAGDLFSALAAFELGCARNAAGPCREAGSRALDLLLGDEAGPMAHDFCLCAVTTIGVVDQSAVLADWPLALRRCATLAHAGHASRLLGGFVIDRPRQFEQVRDWAGDRWQLCSLVDRLEAPEWLRDWLEPDIVSGYLLRRVDNALDHLERDVRPTEWVERVRKKVEQVVRSGKMITFMLRGPLDEFGTAAAPWELEDGGADLSEMSGDSKTRLATILRFLVDLRMPADREAAATKIIQAVGADGEDRDRIIDAVMSVAARWRMPELADQILHIIREETVARPISTWAGVLLAVESAAASPTPEGQVERARSVIDELAGREIRGDSMARLVSAIDDLSDFRPDWAPGLSAARSAALLAS